MRNIFLHRRTGKLRFNYLTLIQMLQTFVYDDMSGHWELHLYVHEYDSSFPCSWAHGIVLFMFHAPVCHVVFEPVDVPCPGPFHCSHIADNISDLCPLVTQMLVFLSLYVILSIWPTSFHFGMYGRKFVLCLFGQCQLLQEVQIMEEA